MTAKRDALQRLFTPEQANKALPLVRRIARDIVDSYRGLYDVRAEHDKVKGQIDGAPTPGQGDDLQRLEQEADHFQEQVENCLEELDLVGCQLKDFEKGLIDFPSEMEGEPVLLCWKLGEPAVEFWHSLDGGFSARQPIAS